MGKPLNTEIVEYCYRQGMVVKQNIPYIIITGEFPNETTETRYMHEVRITYELKDSEKKLLKIVPVTHSINGLTEMDNNSTVESKVNTQLPIWDAEDKLEYSNYIA